MSMRSLRFAVAMVVLGTADLVVLRGDPSVRIEDIEKVEWVLKDGLGYDPVKLIDSVRGQVGQ